MNSDLSKPLDVKHKVVENYALLLKLVEGLRVVNNKIVVTMGSWDLLLVRSEIV